MCWSPWPFQSVEVHFRSKYTLTLFHATFFSGAVKAVSLNVEPPEGFICPSQNITCKVDSVSAMRLSGDLLTTPVAILVTDSSTMDLTLWA